jgi:Flp pilus assembly protein TadG
MMRIEPILGALLAAAGRFHRDTRGVSAVEFALIAPVMLVMYLGAAEMTMALTADRKVTGSATAVADLVTQDDVITNAELADIYAAGDAIVFPYDPDNLSIRITSIRMDIDGDVFVDWSEGRGLAPLDDDSLPDLPDGLLAPMNSIIMVEARYPFQGPFPKTTVEPLVTLSDTAYLRPRRSAWVRRAS